MSKKKPQIIENLLITDIAAEGVAVGRSENFVIFVAGVIPGDVVNVMLTPSQKLFRIKTAGNCYAVARQG